MAVETKEKLTASEAREAIREINELRLKLIDAVLRIAGKAYPLKDRVTVSDYAKRYKMSVGRVQNWIAREVIPPNVG